MGIEPTGDARHAPPNGFEDRGHHQVYEHFRFVYRLSISTCLSVPPLPVYQLAAP